MLTCAAGGYEYTPDLLAREQQGTAEGKPAGQARVQNGSIATPLVVAEWEAALTTHPDQVYVQYLLRGLRNGFRIGFDRAHRLRSV